jgi:hypothetical protein
VDDRYCVSARVEAQPGLATHLERLVTDDPGLAVIVVDHDMFIQAVNEHAKAKAGGGKCAEQQEAVCGPSPGEKKQKRDDHQ